MKKNGRTAAGSQRWKCGVCRMGTTVRRDDLRRVAQLDEFLAWLLDGRFQSDMDASGGRTFRNHTSWCWDIVPRMRATPSRHRTVMTDGTYMSHGWCLLIAIDGVTGETIAWGWCSHESTAAYLDLFSRIPAPDVSVSDGLRGVEKACARAWPGTRIQRCLVHVQRNTRADLTSRPRLQAGKELKRLSDALTKVRDAGQAAAWGSALNDWYRKWKGFLEERTHARDDPSNPKAARQEWWWTHGDVRRCHGRLERLFREGRLFTFCDPALLGKGPVERNTNRLEGGVNSLIKRTLAHHHGLTEEHMRRAAEWVCYMKSESPDPHTLIPDAGEEHGTDAPAVQDEPKTRSNYDNGIQSYNRDDPAVETGFHIRKGHVG